MKKLFALLLALTLLCATALVSCNNSNSGNGDTTTNDTTSADNVSTEPDTTEPEVTDTLTGTPEEIYNQMYEKSKLELGMLDGCVISAEDALYTLGLSEEDFNTHVTEAYLSQPMMTSRAHMVSVIKAKDAESAKALKDLIAASFDPQRWVCVTPNQCVVVESGAYVLFIASSNENTEAFLDAFKEMAGSNIGEVNTFFTDELA